LSKAVYDFRPLSVGEAVNKAVSSRLESMVVESRTLLCNRRPGYLGYRMWDTAGLVLFRRTGFSPVDSLMQRCLLGFQFCYAFFLLLQSPTWVVTA